MSIDFPGMCNVTAALLVALFLYNGKIVLVFPHNHTGNILQHAIHRAHVSVETEPHTLVHDPVYG